MNFLPSVARLFLFRTFTFLLFFTLLLVSPFFSSRVYAETTSWQTTTKILPGNVANSATATYQNGTTAYVYVIAGRNSGGNVNTVYYASIDSSTGDITSSWHTSSNTFPLSVQGATAAIYQQGSTPYIYVIGGRNGSNSASTTVYYASINTSTGDVGTWTAASNTIPVGTLSPTSAIYQSATSPYLYVVAGQNNGFSTTKKTYYTAINPTTGDLGAWTTSANDLPAALNKAASVLYQSGSTAYMYVIGGSGSSTALNTVYYTSINTSTGAIGAWSTSATTLTTALYSPGIGLDTSTSTPYIYVMGGKDNSNASCLLL